LLIIYSYDDKEMVAAVDFKTPHCLIVRFFFFFNECAVYRRALLIVLRKAFRVNWGCLTIRHWGLSDSDWRIRPACIWCMVEAACFNQCLHWTCQGDKCTSMDPWSPSPILLIL